MSKYLKSPKLLQLDPPEMLDRRILLAGALAAERHRRAGRRRAVWKFSAAAAVVAIAATATWQIVPFAASRYGAERGKTPTAAAIRERADKSLSEQELLRFTDWTELEQENYNLASQLNNYQDIQENGFSSQV